MKRLLALAAALAIGACADPTSPPADRTTVSHGQAVLSAPANGPQASGLTVMTWNVYYGTDPMPVLLAPPESVPFVAARAWAIARQTDFPQRAGTIARAIAVRRPHLIGLQEAALWRIQSPGDLVLGGDVPATTVVYDFVNILLDSLKARGLDYRLAAADSTTDVEVPVFNPANGSDLPFDDVRLTDRDVVLVRGDVETANPASARYAAYLPFSLGGIQSGLYEGWSAVDATVSGRTYRFVSTHLEIQQFEPLPVLQAQELVALPEGQSGPVIVVGDFNSDVYGKDPSAASPSYGMMEGAGFHDAWLRGSGSPASPPGLTCCQSGDLLNRRSSFNQRVDFIFTRGLPSGAVTVARQVVGDGPGDRTASGLWPSDHGGVVSTFLVPPGPRH